MPTVQDLQHFTVEELRVEVLGVIQNLLAEADKLQRLRVAQGVSSPRELSAESRTLLQRAPAGEKAVKID
jgi:hypothetical protein